MTKTQAFHKGHGRTIGKYTLLIFVSCVAILWSWNSFAVEIFAAPEMKFKHALALEILFIVAVAVYAETVRLIRTNTD